jgi:uncharacterized repeat protein (TIGR01451 family)
MPHPRQRRLLILLVTVLLLVPPATLARARGPQVRRALATQRAVGRLSEMVAYERTRRPAPGQAAPSGAPAEVPPGLSQGALPSGGARSAAPALVDAPRQPATTPDPQIVASFQALDDNNEGIPPDTHGAAGPEHLMTTLNTQVRIQRRDGSVLSTMSLASFWSPLPDPNPVAFDPKVLYDPYGQRWIFTACADGRSGSSALLIAVSQTSDPTGAWNMYRVDADLANQVWADFPSIGFNKSWIVVTTNMYNVSGDAYNRAHVYIFDKADLYGGGAGAHSRVALTTDAHGWPYGTTQVPAITYDPDLETLYLLQKWNETVGELRLYSISGSAGAPLFNDPEIYPSSGQAWSPGFADRRDFAPQFGSLQKIQVNDDRLQNVVYRNGSLWTAHTVLLPASAPTRSSIQWWQISPATGAIEQRGLIDGQSSGSFYAFPSIGVNQYSDVLVGYSRFSATAYASAYYSFRAATDTPNTMRADAPLKQGEASYYKTFSGTRNRWGDYSATMVDPLDDRSFWTIQEYAETRFGGADRWGIWWGQLVARPGVSVAPEGPLVTTEQGQSATVELALWRPPTADVVVSFDGVDPSEGLLSSTALTFTAATWNTPQVLTITGLDDALLDGDSTYVITTVASSADPAYAGVEVPDLEVTNRDDDVADLALAMLDSSDPIERGAVLTYTFVITNQTSARATAVVLTATLAPVLTFESASLAGCGEAAGVVTCQLGDLAALSSTALDVRVLVSSQTLHPFASSAVVSADNFDPNPSDNQAAEQTGVAGVTRTALPLVLRS